MFTPRCLCSGTRSLSGSLSRCFRQICLPPWKWWDTFSTPPWTGWPVLMVLILCMVQPANNKRWCVVNCLHSVQFVCPVSAPRELPDVCCVQHRNWTPDPHGMGLGSAGVRIKSDWHFYTQPGGLASRESRQDGTRGPDSHAHHSQSPPSTQLKWSAGSWCCILYLLIFLSLQLKHTNGCKLLAILLHLKGPGRRGSTRESISLWKCLCRFRMSPPARGRAEN